jgi:hypothetical protein
LTTGLVGDNGFTARHLGEAAALQCQTERSGQSLTNRDAAQAAAMAAKLGRVG